MSRMLSELLDATEPLFSLSIQRLEDISARPSEDVRLAAELIGKVRLKTAELGLDPDDTSPRELHAALLARIDEHDQRLVRQIGGHDSTDNQSLIPLIRSAWEETDIPKGCWVLKHSVAKSMLKKMPPRNVMKLLGYRSVDSMIKHEDVNEIYGAIRFAETDDWLEDFNKQYDSLKPQDFEARKMRVVELSMERWGAAAEAYIGNRHHNITHLKELGVILILPVSGSSGLRGITILALPLLFHYTYELKLYSTFFKMQQVKASFGKIVADTLISDSSKAAVMAGQDIHWRVIQRHFAEQDKSKYPEIFQPHIQPEDLHWRKVGELLSSFIPELEFWHDLEYVALMDRQDGKPVALNMFDVAASYANQLSYLDRSVYRFRGSLWNEIFIRYMGQKNLESQVLRQLDNDMIDPSAIEI